MHCSIMHHGVPIGTVDLTLDGGRGDGVVEVLPAYDAVRHLVQRATQVIADVRDDAPTARAERRERFREAATLTRELQLCDHDGNVVTADYLILTDVDGQATPLLTVIGVRG